MSQSALIEYYNAIVQFVATPLKGRFVVFLKWLLIGYFRLGHIGLGDCPAGLGSWPRMVRAPPQELEIGEKLL